MGSALQSKTPKCPVCRNPNPQHLLTIESKTYWACALCQARFLDPHHLPDRAEERAHYHFHENDPDDPAYRAFLSKLADPLLERLATPQDILDYGAGPGPALAAMLTEAGHNVSIYDPVFAPDETVLRRTYDVVTCTETVEHFHDPAREFEKLGGLLKPGGLLAIMTCFQTEDAKFADWHYRKDPTHVVFYRFETFEYLARHFGWTLESPVKDVVFMRKP